LATLRRTVLRRIRLACCERQRQPGAPQLFAFEPDEIGAVEQNFAGVGR
jgi:hypothetical protein